MRWNSRENYVFYSTLIKNERKREAKSDPKQKQIFKNFTHFRFLFIIPSTSYIHLTNKQAHKKDYFYNIRRVQELLLTSSQWCMKASSFFLCLFPFSIQKMEPFAKSFLSFNNTASLLYPFHTLVTKNKQQQRWSRREWDTNSYWKWEISERKDIFLPLLLYFSTLLREYTYHHDSHSYTIPPYPGLTI